MNPANRINRVTKRGIQGREMTGSNRRSVLLGGLAVSSGMFASAGFGPLGMASLLAAPSRVALPGEPMELTRMIERGLNNGASLTVMRRWRVVFEAQGRGIAITGRQIDARVDAPERLAPIARIEEQRPTDEMWPILLGSDGVIRGAGTAMRAQDLAAALAEARRMIAAKALPAEAQARHRAFFAQLQQAGGSLFEQLPPDLFFPHTEPVRRIERIEIADGLAGEFELAYRAIPAADAPWLGTASRTVITRFGSDERLSREEWSLAPA